MQVSTFGIMPPEIVPSAISLRASFTDSSGISFFDLSSTPGTSVSSSRRFAFSAPATAPAKVSALTLSVWPVFEVASGASTGISSWPISWLSSVRSTFSGSPTKPRSIDLLDVGIRIDHGARRLRRHHHVAVLAAQADGLAAGLVDVADELLVDRAGQHHLDDLDGRRIGDAQALRRIPT